MTDVHLLFNPNVFVIVPTMTIWNGEDETQQRLNQQLFTTTEKCTFYNSAFYANLLRLHKNQAFKKN